MIPNIASIEQPDVSLFFSAATIRNAPSRSSRPESTGTRGAAHSSRKRSICCSAVREASASRAGVIPKIQIAASSERRSMSVRGMGWIRLRIVSFAKLIQRFKSGFQPTEAKPSHDPLRLATSAVLLDIAYADGEFSPAEDGDIAGYLKRAFALDDASARHLLKAADEIRTQTIDHFALTNFIRRNSPLNERIDI